MAKKTSVTITDRDHGYKRVLESLGEMGHVTVGVQGDEAKEIHPQPTRFGGQDGHTVGQIAAIHELGLGVPRRSWLVSWMDANGNVMRREAADAMRQVIKGTKTRKQALAELGYRWTAGVRDQIYQGKIRPRLSETTVAIKGGESRPLVETFTLHNAITYKVFLPNKKSIRNTIQRAAVRRGKL